MKTKRKYFYLDDFEHRLLVGCLFPELVKSFVDKVRELFAVKETQEREAREAAKRAQREKHKNRGWER